MRTPRLVTLGILAIINISAASASTILYEGSYTGSGNPLAASASFSLSGQTLTITLTNQAGPNATTYSNPNVLMAVFFGSSALDLTPQSAVAGETVWARGTVVCAANCDVGDSWEYKTFSTRNYGAFNGISAAGLGIFDTARANFANTGELDKHGIVPARYPGTLGTQVNSQWQPFALDSVVFNLRVPTGFTLSPQTIGPVTFQYGTSLSEPSLRGILQEASSSVTQTPEPVTSTLLGCGLAALGLVRRRAVWRS